MFRNKKQSDLEIAIESARYQKDWNTLWNLMKKYSKISPDSLLEEITHADYALETRDLAQARLFLNKARLKDAENEEVLALFGKLEYESKNIDIALQYFSSIKVPPPDQSLPPRIIRLVLQSLQLKGLCHEARLEHHYARDAYRRLLDLANRAFPSFLNMDFVCKSYVETALLSLPLLQSNDVNSSIELLRQALSVPFDLSPNISSTALRTLAHLLSRKSCDGGYPIIQEEQTNSNLRYTPRTKNEEALLALLKLSQDPNGSPDVYEDICATYSRLDIYSPIVESYERFLSQRFGDVHQWFQLGLALMTSGRSRRALNIMVECLARDPKNPVLLMLATKLSINSLDQTQAGLTYATKAIEVLGDRSDGRIWAARAHMAVGIANSKLALQSKSYATRKKLQEEALKHSLIAHKLDTNDAEILYNLALIYSDIRDISHGIKYVRKSLALDKTSSHAWNLLSMLLSAQKKYKIALSVCTHALAEDPTNISLTLTKAKLEQAVDEPLQALQTYKASFAQFSLSPQNDTTTKDNPAAMSVYSDGRTMNNTRRQPPVNNATAMMSQVGSMEDAISIAPSQARTHSHSLHAYSKEHPDEVAPGEDPMLTRLWLSAAEAFAQAGQFIDAVECLQEAKALDNTNPDIFYQEGCMMEMQELYLDSLTQYQKALAVDSSHAMSMIRMATVSYERTKDLALAEHLLTSVLRSDPTCHQAWFQLGVVLKSKIGEEARAAECFQRAIELDKTSPVIPFHTIPRELP